MTERRERPEHRSIADQHIETAESLVQGETEAVDALIVLEIKGNQRGRSAQSLDRIIELLETADRARYRNDMGAGLGQCERGRVTDAA